jgi:capsular polysaccharide biosynthesis protein
MPELNLPSNQIQDFLNLLRRKTMAVAICGLAGLSATVVVLCFISPKYASWTRIEVGDVRFEEDRLLQNPQYTDYKDLQNASFLILSEANLQKCIKDELQWNDFLAVENFVTKKQEYLDDVRKRTTIDRAKKDKDIGKDYITITYKDEDPKRAAAFANKIAELWMAGRIDSMRDKYRKELDDARTAFEKAQNRVGVARQKVANQQEAYGLSPTQSTSGKVAVDEDPVFKLLLQARETLVRAETDWRSQEEKYKGALELYASTPTEVEEVVDSKTAAASPQAEGVKPLIDSLTRLKDEIEKLKTQQKGFKQAHPKYGLAQADIDKKTKEQKEIEEKLAKAGVSATGDQPMIRRVLNPAKDLRREEVARAETELRARKVAYDDAKKRADQLEEDNKKRVGIFKDYSTLRLEVETEETNFARAKETVTKKENILKTITSPAGNPYSITDGAVPSDKPVEPPVALFLAAGLFGGAGAGLGWIFMREFVRSTYRSVQDAAASLSIPVLGYVNEMATRSEIRRNRRRQIAGVSVSLAVILLIGGSASLYLLQPKLLPAPMKAAIDSVKTKFR